MLDELLILIKSIAEYALGVHVGYFLGWATGLYVGHFYVDHFEPVYMKDFSQLSYWRALPNLFAQNGAWIGLAAGMIAIVIMNHRPFIKEIDSLYEVEIDNPHETARLPSKDIGQIKW